MYGSFEALHNRYLEPPEDKVYGYDWHGMEIYRGDQYRIIGKDKVLEDDVEEYLRNLYLTEPPVTRIRAYDWKGEKTDEEWNYYLLDGDYVNEDDVDEYLKENYLDSSILTAGE